MEHMDKTEHEEDCGKNDGLRADERRDILEERLEADACIESTSEEDARTAEEEEEYYQDQLFRIEKQKILEANKLKKQGKKVIIDKSAIATVATAKAFEEPKGFNGTFKRAYMKYCEMLQELKNEGLIECDVFLLLTADYNTICERNKTRNHILEGIWLEEKTIVSQREVLEKMTDEIVGSISKNTIKKKILDTSSLTKKEVLDEFNELLNNWERNELEIE